MKSTPFRTLAVLLTAGFLAGSATAPAAEGSQAAKSSRRTALSVSLSCSQSGFCSAVAKGGTGVYESWEWYGAVEDGDWGGSYSFADANPYCVPGLVLGVSAVVTDSSGATASGDALIFCSNSNG